MGEPTRQEKAEALAASDAAVRCPLCKAVIVRAHRCTASSPVVSMPANFWDQVEAERAGTSAEPTDQPPAPTPVEAPLPIFSDRDA